MTINEFRKQQEKRNQGKAAASEHDLQVQCVHIFRMLYPNHWRLLMAIPNGGYRTATTARKMRAEGVQAGVPDMLLAVARKGYHGLWIEMKNGKAGRVSELQTEMIARLKAEGYACAVCRTQEEFVNTIKEYID